MAKQINVGIDGVIKKVSKVTCGVDGVVKTVKKGTCGIDGVVKEFFASELVLYNNGVQNGATFISNKELKYTGTAGFLANKSIIIKLKQAASNSSATFYLEGANVQMVNSSGVKKLGYTEASSDWSANTEYIIQASVLAFSDTTSYLTLAFSNRNGTKQTFSDYISYVAIR